MCRIKGCMIGENKRAWKPLSQCCYYGVQGAWNHLQSTSSIAFLVWLWPPMWRAFFRCAACTCTNILHHVCWSHSVLCWASGFERLIQDLQVAALVGQLWTTQSSHTSSPPAKGGSIEANNVYHLLNCRTLYVRLRGPVMQHPIRSLQVNYYIYNLSPYNIAWYGASLGVGDKRQQLLLL